MFEERNFIEYRETFSARWQSKILLILLITAFAILGIECSTYALLLKNNERVVFSFSYIFKRIICPTILNFGTILLASILRKKKSLR